MTPAVKRSNRNKIYSKIVTFFLILTIAAIFIIAHFALSKATITINSTAETTNDSVLIEMLPADSQEIPVDSIRGQILETDFELTVSVPTSQIVVNTELAGGYVSIINNYSKDQTLVSTTRLLTEDGKLYRISDRVVVPAGQTVQVWAQADQSGPDFVIGPTKFTIPGLWVGLQDYIYAEAPDGMKLEGVPRSVVTQENLADAAKKIQEQARLQAATVFNSSLSTDLQLDDKKIRIVLETINTSEVGQEVSEATLTQKVHAYGLVFDNTDLRSTAQEKFLKELGGKQALAQFNDYFEYQIVEVNQETDKAVIEVSLEASVKGKENADKIDKQKIAGQNSEQIDTYLRSVGFDDFDIELFPFWIKKAPKLLDHIIIE